MKKIIALLICSFILVAVSGSATETIFTFDVVNTQTISGVVSTTEQITIDWGDESSGNYNGIDQAYSHDYGSAGNRTVTITATDESCLTKFTMSQSGANVSFALSDLPSGLTYFECTGSNTVSGSLFGLPSDLTYFRCQGSNTVSGSLSDLPSGLAYFYCTGLNTVSGSLFGLPSDLTYFRCQGSNTVSGSLSDLPSGLAYFYCTGSNTVSGSLSDLPSDLTTFSCSGSNTVSGSLSDLPSDLTDFGCGGSNTVSGSLSDLPSDLTYFSCSGSNTVSGSLSDLPSDLTTFSCSGSNTVSGYSTKLWTTKPATFVLTPVSGGLSTAEVDQLLIDLDDDLVWSGGNIITLNGTNAPRSATSDAAVASIEGEGATVTTSSVLQLGNIYKITATEANHFGTGLEVDDYFVSNGTETVNASNKVKQVTDCAATGALIISALGGSTRSWTSVDAGFNPKLACTYEIYDVTLTGLADQTNDIYIYDSAGAFLRATMKAQGSGETLGDNSLTSITQHPTVPYDTLTVNVNGYDINSAIAGASGGRAYSNTIADTLGKLWAIETDITINSGQAPSLRSKLASPEYGYGMTIGDVTDNTYYYTTDYTVGHTGDANYRESGLILVNTVAANYSLVWTLKQVTAPSTSGVTLQASKWDATESFGYVNPAFKLNQDSYEVRVYKAR